MATATRERLISVPAARTHIDAVVADPILKACMHNALDGLPAADAAPVVHGRWKYYHKQNIAVCTNCSFERDLSANFGKAISCPNCAAKMDE